MTKNQGTALHVRKAVGYLRSRHAVPLLGHTDVWSGRTVSLRCRSRFIDPKAYAYTPRGEKRLKKQ